MERTVIDAVRGSLTVAPSRTAHFLSKGRCETPMRRAPSDSSETESEEEGATAVTRQPDSSSEGTGESSYYEESESATEMDLITRSFKKTAVPLQTPGEVQPSSGQQQNEPDMSEFSSQDTTLKELREQSGSTTRTTSKSKKRKSDRRGTDFLSMMITSKVPPQHWSLQNPEPKLNSVSWEISQKLKET